MTDKELVLNFISQYDRLFNAELISKLTSVSREAIEKLLPELAKEQSIKEIENTIISNIKAKKDEPRINVFVNEQHLDFIRKRVDEELSKSNYSTQININSDTAISITDCRVEWSEGGAERLFEDLLKQMESAINNSISGLEMHKNNQ